MYDIIIIGAGPAGMTAAIYAKQAKKNVLVLEKDTYGGQILKASKVKNYPGFDEISGYEYSEKLYNQLTNLEVEVKFEEVFERLTGTPLTRDCHIFLSKYAYGGMSSGQICGDFWTDTALPLLVERLRRFK